MLHHLHDWFSSKLNELGLSALILLINGNLISVANLSFVLHRWENFPALNKRENCSSPSGSMRLWCQWLPVVTDRHGKTTYLRKQIQVLVMHDNEKCDNHCCVSLTFCRQSEQSQKRIYVLHQLNCECSFQDKHLHTTFTTTVLLKAHFWNQSSTEITGYRYSTCLCGQKHKQEMSNQQWSVRWQRTNHTRVLREHFVTTISMPWF